jgi:hypothetical protein
VRTSVLGYQQIALASGRAAFRCLLDVSKMAGRAEFDWLGEGPSGPRGVRAQDGRYLFLYTCRDKTLLNIVAHYGDPRDQDKCSKFLSISCEATRLNFSNRLERSVNKSRDAHGVRRL